MTRTIANKFIIILAFSSMMTFGVSAQTFLHAKGQDIVDESDRKVLLRGVGLGNWMLPEGYMWKFGNKADRPRKIEKLVADHIGSEKAEQFWKTFRRNYITEADIKRIAELGFNSVRPALNARLFLTEGEKNEFVDEGFELLDNLIGWCKKYHLYVIIDMHAAPGGQTGANIDDSPNNEPELFTNPKNQDLLEKLWVKIADRYKDEPCVAAYDLLNEPLPERTGAAAKYKNELVPLYQRLIKTIRQVDKKHIFTLEGYDWANNWSLFETAPDNNIMYQFHYYCWDNPDNLNDISHFLKKQEKLNAPVWVGETGEKNEAIYFATTQYFEKHNIGWSFWPWKKMDTGNTPYSIKPPENWKDITTYSREGGNTVATDPEKIFNQFLENIKLENCVYFPSVVNSVFRQVPLKIEAENYGEDGFKVSYFVKDTLTKSLSYRKKEPVKIKVVHSDRRELASSQVIELNAGEWTVYKFKSPEKKKYNVSIQVKTTGQPSEMKLIINGKPVNLKVDQTDLNELKLTPQLFKKGENEMKVEVKSGSVDLDWINIY